MLTVKQLGTFAGVLAFALVGLVPVAGAQSVQATLKASQVAVQNGVADATFTVVVSNPEAAPITNVWVVFADNTEVAIGDVAAEGTSESGSQSRSFDVSEALSATFPVPVTLKYSTDGTAVEQASTVYLTIRQ